MVSTLTWKSRGHCNMHVTYGTYTTRNAKRWRPLPVVAVVILLNTRSLRNSYMTGTGSSVQFNSNSAACLRVMTYYLVAGATSSAFPRSSSCNTSVHNHSSWKLPAVSGPSNILPAQRSNQRWGIKLRMTISNAKCRTLQHTTAHDPDHHQKHQPTLTV
jgi:hypothetical protein